MAPVWAFLLVTLATARVTRLVVVDQISAPTRRWIAIRFGEKGWLAYLFHCPFCMSVWLSFIGSAAWIMLASMTWWLWLPGALAMSYLVAPILVKFDREN